MIPDIAIRAADTGREQPVSAEFLQIGITRFSDATEYIKRLPYARNADKNDPLCVLNNGCGTCSTKHALLKTLADEQEVHAMRLMMGIFRMNGQNTPPVAGTLLRYDLPYIPEAHNYLRYHDNVIDVTTSAATTAFLSDLLAEEEITIAQITTYKIERHRSFLTQWLWENTTVRYTLDELWAIREECIAALSK
jgi:hypothetical protein